MFVASDNNLSLTMSAAAHFYGESFCGQWFAFVDYRENNNQDKVLQGKADTQDVKIIYFHYFTTLRKCGASLKRADRP